MEYFEEFDKKVALYSQQFLEYANPDILTKPQATAGWCLTSGQAAFYSSVGYLLFVLFGTLVMKCARRPIKIFSGLKYIYNPIQVVLCSWMCLEAARQAYNLPNAKIVGNTFDYSRVSVANVLWVFYISKILDFMDTFFIIMEQRWRQLTFLHVYHHVSIFLTYWVLINVGYDGDIYLTVVLNSFVHFVMYLYYLIQSLNLYAPLREYKDVEVHVKRGSDYQAVANSGKNVADERALIVLAKRYDPWWKSLVTYMQMLQFLIMNAQAVYLIQTNGAYPSRIIWFYLFYIQSLFWLFAQFAMQTYCKKDKSKSKPKTQ